MGGMSLCTKCTCLTGSWDEWGGRVYQVYMFNRVMEWVGWPCVPSVHVSQGHEMCGVSMRSRVIVWVGCLCVAGS